MPAIIAASSMSATESAGKRVAKKREICRNCVGVNAMSSLIQRRTYPKPLSAEVTY